MGYKFDEVEATMVMTELLEKYWPVQVLHEMYGQYPDVDKYYFQKFVAEHLEFVRRHKICEKIGHKWVSDGSYGNPETGGEYGHCTRCGWDFDVTYY